MSCLLVLKEPGKARLRVIASAPRLGRLHRWWTRPIYQDACRAMRIAVAADGVHRRDRRSGSLFKPGQGLDDDRTAAPAALRPTRAADCSHRPSRRRLHAGGRYLLLAWLIC